VFTRPYVWIEFMLCVCMDVYGYIHVFDMLFICMHIFSAGSRFSKLVFSIPWFCHPCIVVHYLLTALGGYFVIALTALC
jgi:hypothetical protein